MESAKDQEAPSKEEKGQSAGTGEAEQAEDDFIIEGVNDVSKKLDNVKLNEEGSSLNKIHHLDDASKPKTQMKVGREFKPKNVGLPPSKSKLEDKGRIFVPKQKPEEESKVPQQYDEQADGEFEYCDGDIGGYYPEYEDPSAFNTGAPEYMDGPPEDMEALEDDFLKFQHESEQIEMIHSVVGDFGEGLIRFEESSKECECCQGLVERCDGDICQTLGECYCVSHNKNKDKS